MPTPVSRCSSAYLAPRSACSTSAVPRTVGQAAQPHAPAVCSAPNCQESWPDPSSIYARDGRLVQFGADDYVRTTAAWTFGQGVADTPWSEVSCAAPVTVGPAPCASGTSAGRTADHSIWRPARPREKTAV